MRGRDKPCWEVRSPGLRNEPLDTRVYAVGALGILNPNLKKHLERRLKAIKAEPVKAEESAESAETKPERKRVRKKTATQVLSRGMRF